MKRAAISGKALAAGYMHDERGRPKSGAMTLWAMADGSRASALSLKATNCRGVTLVEVLMSLMIMSIGVSAVAVLFPISVLRSVQATQLTSAAILSTNAKTLLEMRTELVFDPDGDGNLDEHIGREEELHYIVDPGGYFEIASDPTGFLPSALSCSIFPTLSPLNNASTPNDSTLRGGADWFGNTDLDGNGAPESQQFLRLGRMDSFLPVVIPRKLGLFDFWVRRFQSSEMPGTHSLMESRKHLCSPTEVQVRALSRAH
jgi:prepilin-type N-terminal cleavage/methylation domain-containing protein